jgi:hypothetical protein
VSLKLFGKLKWYLAGAAFVVYAALWCICDVATESGESDASLGQRHPTRAYNQPALVFVSASG